MFGSPRGHHDANKISSPTQEVVHICPSISTIASSSDRVNALYSPFRPRPLNPESFDLKLKFWTKALDEWVTFSERLTFTLKEVQKGMMIAQKTPACLEDVLEFCAKDGSIVSTKEFYDTLSASISWVAWGQVNAKRLVGKVIPSLPAAPWTYFTRGKTPPEQRYVHVGHLKDLVDTLSKSAPLRNRLLSLDTFTALVTSQTGISDPGELSILLDYLRARKLIEVDKVGKEDVVIFGDSLKISDVDKGRYDVKRSIEIHEERLEEVHVQMEEAVMRAKDALKQGRRAKAKYELKKKKMLEARADKLLSVVDSLTVIGMRLDEAESDAQILQAYQSGKQALADVLKKNNLTVDAVTEAMLDVQEVLEESGEVSAAISQPLDGGQTDDLEELDAELDALLKEDAEKEAEKRKGEATEGDDSFLMKRLVGLKVREDEDGFGDAGVDGDENVSSRDADISSEM
ncbi:charged multivesicular body protein 7 [Folsomia candida]|uniref:charged multivesicular body protein 7 n=1 Tax=Folsomia candida TaxID=158441 RepID=UPI000B8F3DD2|nr:charged multivesicular body protein 7 [Folsomia candida]